MTYYPSIEDVISAHGRLIERFGGAAGLRDRAALESALAPPQTGYYEDLIQEAAALWESLTKPSLLDGKRTAVTAAFLRVNGYKLAFDDMAAFQFLMELYENRKFRFGELEGWLREHASPLR